MTATLTGPDAPQPVPVPGPRPPKSRPVYVGGAVARSSSRPSCGRRRSCAFGKVEPADDDGRNPVMFIVEIGSASSRRSCSCATAAARPQENVFAVCSVAVWLWFTVLFANFAEAMAEGRGKAQADTLRRTRERDDGRVRRPDGSIEEASVVAPAGRRPLCRFRRRRDPGRRRRRRGHRHGRRVGDHRRVGPGDPGVGRRPLGGHRRHAGAQRRDRRADHRQARRDVPRSDDRPRRGRRPAEDAERDRPDDPAGRAHDHLRARRRHPAALRVLLGRRAERHRARRPVGVPDPDHDRRTAVGDRHRRHGPPRAAQRAGDVRPGGRGGR